MIFSLKKHQPISTEDIHFDGDIFCLYSHVGAVDASRANGFNCLISSLKNKRNILLLDRPITEIPPYNPAKRWDTGESWIWISPRAANFLLESFPERSLNFVLFCNFLQTAK